MQKSKKYHYLLLLGMGTSTFGDFIYLVAINVLILQLTNSAAAVAGLWIMGPLAAIITKFWSGSLIDRLNKRSLMIVTDLIRACLVAVIPFLSSLSLIYACLFFLAIAKAFFEPTSITYITKLVPQEDRKKFNSYRSLVTSGAFLVGPAIAGGLLLISTAKVAIWINALSFIVSALVLSFLPNIDVKEKGKKKFNLELLIVDWKKVIQYSKTHTYIVSIYFIIQLFMIIALGMDAQEVVFTQKVIGLSETDYGLLISITGIGYVVGSAFVSYYSQKLSIQRLIGIGHFMVAIGYIIYAFSNSFFTIATGFVLLGFFNAFSSTGFMTFFQNNVPQEMMGRISSIYGLFQSILQITLIILIGFTGEIFPLRYSIMIASFFCLFLSVLLAFFVFPQSKRRYFLEMKTHENSIESV